MGSNPSTDMKYSDEQLAQAAAISKSVAEVCRVLGMDHPGGSMQTHIRNRIRRAGIDTSHFLGQASNRGKASHNKRTPEQILVYYRHLPRRERASILRSALVSVGRPYQCEQCRNAGQWMGESLTLEIHHVNGDWLDNRKENLQLVCPNCHQQLDRDQC